MKMKMNKDRIVRLKDGSIVVCIDPDRNPRYQYIINRDGKIGKNLTGGGSSYSPASDDELWNKEFELDESDVKYELRYRYGDCVQDLHPEKEFNKFTGTVGEYKPPYDIPKEEFKECMKIVAIPANIMAGIHDYTVNRIDSRGIWSTSSTAADANLVSASEEEVKIWSEKMKKYWNRDHPDSE